jgi:hypothetical protein
MTSTVEGGNCGSYYDALSDSIRFSVSGNRSNDKYFCIC